MYESYLNPTETHAFPGRDTGPCPQRGSSCVLSQSLPNREMEGLLHCALGFPAVPRSTIGIAKALAPCWQRTWPHVAAVSSRYMFPHIGEALLLPAWLRYTGQFRDSLLSLRAQSALSNWGKALSLQASAHQPGQLLFSCSIRGHSQSQAEMFFLAASCPEEDANEHR